MEDMLKAFSEYVDLAMKAHKAEDEMLAIPKSAGEKSCLSLDLLFVADNRSGLFGNRLLEKYKELREVERQRDEARKRFMRLFAH